MGDHKTRAIAPDKSAGQCTQSLWKVILDKGCKRVDVVRPAKTAPPNQRDGTPGLFVAQGLVANEVLQRGLVSHSQPRQQRIPAAARDHVAQRFKPCSL